MEPFVPHFFLYWLFRRIAIQLFSWNVFSLSHRIFLPLSFASFFYFLGLLSSFMVRLYFHEAYLPNIGCEGGKYFKTLHT